MKKLWLIAILLVVLSLNLFADDVTIGTGTSNGNPPFNAQFGFGRSAALYTAAEIGITGNITHLSWNIGTASTTVIPIKIYAKMVTIETLTAANWATLTDGATLLYDNDQVFSPVGWTTIDITDFDYTGDNLLILCEGNYGDGGTSSYPKFSYTAATGKHLAAQADNNAPTGNLTANANRPNIKITFPNTTAPNAAVIGAPANEATNVAILPTISWSSGTGGTPTGYKLYLGTSNPPTTMIVDQAGASYLLTTALDYETQYFWKVVPYNTFGDATDCPVWSFTTRLDPTRPIPYTQDFNAATTWPTDWVNNGMSISASHGNGGNGVYKNLWSSSASGSFASCPIGPLAAVSEIKFDYRYMAYTGYPGAAHTLAAGDKIEVQISTNDGQTYETIHTIDMDNHTTSNQFATPTVPVIGYEGQIVRVRFLATRGAGDYFVDFDNIIVRETPASPVFAINPEEKDFGVAYMPAGSAPQTFTISNEGPGTLLVNSVAIGGADATEFLLTDTNTYPVSLLTNETITVQVKLNPTSAGEKIAALNIAYNDGSAATFAAPLTGNAVNPIITTFPYTDSFELNNTHNSTNVFYWTQERVGTTTKYWTVNSTETTYNRTPRTGLFDVTLQYSANAWLFRPAQLVAGTSYSIEVYGRQDGAVPTNASLTLKYGDSPEAAAMTGSIVDLTPLVNGEYQRLRGAFIPETSGYYYFGILGTINSSPYYITIDDFMIEETPAIVPNPAVLVSPANAALNVPVLATLSWVPAAEGGDPTAYELYVGTTELPALPTANLTETSYTFTTPLEYGTEYIWQVVPKNATGSAANCPVWSFKTMEDPTVTTFPFTEGFEGTQFPPLGWSQISVTGSKPWIRNTGTKHSGNASAQGQWEGSGSEHLLITPPLDLGTNNYRLRFWLYGTTYAVTKLKVQIADNNALAGSFVTDLAEYTGGSTMPSGWTRKEIDLTGYEGVQYIAFRIVDQNGLSIYIDDIVIDEIPTTPIFAADPIEKDFAGIGMGQSSADQTFTITNTGIGTLVIDSATITGENAGQFVLTDSNTYPKSLLEDQSMTVKVKFLPTLEGNLAANLTFDYNDGTDQTANVALTGNGINPIIHNFPHVETFDTFPPLFWTRWTGLLGETSTLTSTTYGWVSNTWFANTTNHENGKATKLNNYGTSRYYWLITPTIDLGDNVPGGYKLEFDLALTEYYDPYPPELDGDDDKFAVIISTDNGETWSSLNALRLWDNAGSDYIYNEISMTGERITINLIGYSGEVKIGFYGESTIQNADNDIHLDNVTITYDATLPVELSAFNTAVLTNNTVSLSWTTQSENNLFGYHLHRSTDDRLNSAERITSSLISPTNTSNEANYTYIDSEVLPETTYYYWLQTVESNGTSQFFGPYSVRTNEGNIVPELPSFTSLQSVYPNPFTGNSHANFGIDVKEGETAQFVIYNIKGQVVKTYKNINPGKHNLVWDGKDNYKKNCAAGIYFYKLSSPSFSQTKKMMYIK